MFGESTIIPEALNHNLVGIGPDEDYPVTSVYAPYATKDNFLGKKVYPDETVVFLNTSAASALVVAERILNKSGLGILVWDGYRPIHVQAEMFAELPDLRYVSDPSRNLGRHTRGTAVDLTVVDLDRSDEPLPMPSEFDDFTESAHRSSIGSCSAEVGHRMRLLDHAMTTAGFEPFATEWWHYDFAGWHDDQRFPAYDISINDLKNGAALASPVTAWPIKGQ